MTFLFVYIYDMAFQEENGLRLNRFALDEIARKIVSGERNGNKKRLKLLLPRRVGEGGQYFHLWAFADLYPPADHASDRMGAPFSPPLIYLPFSLIIVGVVLGGLGLFGI